MSKHYIIIDADSIYFRCAMASQRPKDLRVNISNYMKKIKQACYSWEAEESELKVFVKGTGNFRFDIWNDYKGQRPDLDENIKKAIEFGRQYMIEKYDAIESDDAEADDYVSILAWKCIELGYEYHVVHIDKDLNMIPGNHYNFVKEESYHVNLEQGAEYFLKQCLTGDKADNIPGVKGIGPVKAQKAMDEAPNFKAKVDFIRNAWESKEGLDISSRLLWMCVTPEEISDLNVSVRDRLQATTLSEFWGFEEENNDETYCESETAVSEQDVREEGSSDLQDDGVHEVSE